MKKPELPDIRVWYYGSAISFVLMMFVTDFNLANPYHGFGWPGYIFTVATAVPIIWMGIHLFPGVKSGEQILVVISGLIPFLFATLALTQAVGTVGR